MPQIHDTPYAWFRLLITLIIAIFANTGMWAVITIMPALEAEFVTSRAVTSLPFTMNMIGFAVGNLVIGQIIDRFGVTLSVMAAAICSASAFFCHWQAIFTCWQPCIYCWVLALQPDLAP